ncbi:hypothetical protein MNBD_NITROSPINAE01-1469 [hydrothermal vent metagenome]|uniref:Cytochrome c-552/4 domain-containing protein n=1 Tax=hydrothermal vent metagenome TaxID=652676 RepID=A0A3B1BKM0_9ZZZZ
MQSFLRIALLLAVSLVFTFSGPLNASAADAEVKLNPNGFTSSKVCAECHSQIYSNWKDSMHARATSDPIFRASYYEAHYKSGGKARDLCLRCHAPTTKMTQEYNLDGEITSEGLTCDFCHSLKAIDMKKEFPFILDVGTVKYGPNKKGSDAKIHTIMKSKIHTSARLCASCHEYRPNGVAVMSTYSEWQNGPYALEGIPCQRCHMPEVEGEIAIGVTADRGKKVYSHKLAGGHSVVQLKKALTLSIANVQRAGGMMTVTANVTNSGSGHRVPTGIPTRKLILHCKVTLTNGKTFMEKKVYEKVLFDKDGNELTNDADIMMGLGDSIVKDNRIYPRETRSERFTFNIPDREEASISLWVDYLYQPKVIQDMEMRVEMGRAETISHPGGNR